MQVYGAGGKTTPKKGRLGTGSYHPEGTPLYHHQGNVFPGINPRKQDFIQTTFGDQSRAGVATQHGQNRVQTRGTHPNKSEYNTSTLVLAPAMVVSSYNDQNNLQPTTPFGNGPSLSMPHERHTNSASGTHKKPNPYRTTFGASKSLPNNGNFDSKPNANYTHAVRQRPNSAVEAVKRTASTRTFARENNPLPVHGGVNPKQQHRTPPPSFVSAGNQWSDPNHSFIKGQQNVATGDTGTGRWGIVKKGVV